MVDVNTNNLENALGTQGQPAAQPMAPQMPKDQEIAFLQGALTTLSGERTELVKMLQMVESLMQMHLKRLEELGVKIQQKE